VRATFRYARHHRQDRLLAIECLDLVHMGNSRVKTFCSGFSWQISVGCFDPRSEPARMTRPVSDAASNSHPVAKLCRLHQFPACVGQGFRRAGPFFFAAF
jgi:hypothetical protein